MVKFFDYTVTEGTPWHVLGGILYTLLVGPVYGGLLWGVCMILYQVFDAYPRECAAWNNTKWDVLEIGFGALLAGLVWIFVRVALTW